MSQIRHGEDAASGREGEIPSGQVHVLVALSVVSTSRLTLCVGRLLAVAEEAGEGGGAGALKPNVAALMGGGEDSDEEQSESEDEGAGSRAAKSGAGVYRPPRAHAVPYMVSSYIMTSH